MTVTNTELERLFGTEGQQVHVRPEHPGLIYAGPPRLEVGAPDLKLKGEVHVGEASMWFTGTALQGETAEGTGMTLEIEELEQVHAWLGRVISHLRAERQEEEDSWDE